jgi:hypothetical protein
VFSISPQNSILLLLLLIRPDPVLPPLSMASTTGKRAREDGAAQGNKKQHLVVDPTILNFVFGKERGQKRKIALRRAPDTIVLLWNGREVRLNVAAARSSKNGFNKRKVVKWTACGEGSYRTASGSKFKAYSPRGGMLLSVDEALLAIIMKIASKRDPRGPIENPDHPLHRIHPPLHATQKTRVWNSLLERSEGVLRTQVRHWAFENHTIDPSGEAFAAGVLVSEERGECPVCFCDMKDGRDVSVAVPCGHVFCSSCIAECRKADGPWRSACPTCRTKYKRVVSTDDLSRLSPTPRYYDGGNRGNIREPWWEVLARDTGTQAERNYIRKMLASEGMDEAFSYDSMDSLGIKLVGEDGNSSMRAAMAFATLPGSYLHPTKTKWRVTLREVHVEDTGGTERELHVLFDNCGNSFAVSPTFREGSRKGTWSPLSLLMAGLEVRQA